MIIGIQPIRTRQYMLFLAVKECVEFKGIARKRIGMIHGMAHIKCLVLSDMQLQFDLV